MFGLPASWRSKKNQRVENAHATQSICPICAGVARPLDSVDFNRTCLNTPNTGFQRSGQDIWYYLCARCGFCFVPEMLAWTDEELADRVYNDGYLAVDPDFREGRPRTHAHMMREFFGPSRHLVRHLDYGGGAGLMSRLLEEEGWNSRSYDPFFQDNPPPAEGERFNLITAFEVLEHSTDPRGLINRLVALLDDPGLLFLSTLLSDGQVAKDQKLDWWYAAPRNGHVSLFSGESLAVLARENQLFCMRHPNGHLHILGRTIPEWAKPVLEGRAP